MDNPIRAEVVEQENNVTTETANRFHVEAHAESTNNARIINVLCIDGFSLVNGQCQAVIPGSVDFSKDFQTTDGADNGWTIPDTALNVVAAGSQTIEWLPAKTVVDEYNTKVQVDLSISAGNFGVAFRRDKLVEDTTILMICLLCFTKMLVLLMKLFTVTWWLKIN